MTVSTSSRGAAGDLRARALLDDGRERRPRRRSSADTSSGSQERLTENGYDGDVLLLHSGGGVMTPKTGSAVRRPAGGVGHRRRRDRQPPHRHAVRLPERDRPRHGRDEHGHLARLRGRGAGDEGVVRRVRLPDLLPVDRGADDRRRRRLDRLDRRGRLAAERPAVGRRATPGPACYGRGNDRADEHGREPRPRPARRRADRRGDDASTATPPSGRSRSTSPRRSGSGSSRRRARSSRSRTRTWPTPSA